MIDLATETPLTLSGAARYINGRFRAGETHLHISTLHRWCGKGIRGARLETLSLGGKKITSVEALNRFFARLAGNESVETASVSAPAGATTPVAGSAARDRRAAAAEAALERAGV